jgi:glycosyltransferase involved in cell wall biosynthesis
MPIALVTTYLAGYRTELYKRLAQRHDVEVLCHGGGERYVPGWLTDLETQLSEAPFPARRLDGLGAAFALGRRYDAVIAPFAGGAMLPATYAGARLWRRPFVLWASVWSTPRSASHALARPVTNHIYRRADAVIAYGEHVRRYVAGIRGRDDDVFVAPQAVEPELFARTVPQDEVDAFRARHALGEGPLVLYAGRLVHAKGVDVLLDAWTGVGGEATLLIVGDGELVMQAREAPRARFIGPLARAELPAAYASAQFAVLPSVRTPRFVEPWGLVCNEAMHQARPVVASDAVGAVAGGLVRGGRNGLVVPAGDGTALTGAIELLLKDQPLRDRLGAQAQADVAAYSYDAMVDAFDRALATAIKPSPTGPENAR